MPKKSKKKKKSSAIVLYDPQVATSRRKSKPKLSPTQIFDGIDLMITGAAYFSQAGRKFFDS